MAECLGLRNLLKKCCPSNAKLLLWLQLWDDVVVVAVEPLGHFTGGDRVAAGHTATGHAKQSIEADFCLRILVEAGGHGAKQAAPLQNRVIPSEIANR